MDYKQAKLGTGEQVHLENCNNVGILFIVHMKFEQGKSLAAAGRFLLVADKNSLHLARAGTEFFSLPSFHFKINWGFGSHC